jgi:hypothetical protein
VGPNQTAKVGPVESSEISKIPLERAIPAGAFLLFFIALFGWSVYRDKRVKQTAQAG